jgi:hypothetical protein
MTTVVTFKSTHTQADEKVGIAPSRTILEIDLIALSNSLGKTCVSFSTLVSLNDTWCDTNSWRVLALTSVHTFTELKA